jgi:hypothetical protein
MDSYSQQRFAAESAANNAYKKRKRKLEDETSTKSTEQMLKYVQRMNDESSTKRSGSTVSKKLFN